MKQFLLISIVLVRIAFPAVAQEAPLRERNSVYKVNPWVTIPITAAAAVTNYYGVRFLKSKPGIDSATAVSLGPDDVNAFDRGATRQLTFNEDEIDKTERVMKMSDIVMSATTLTPGLLLFDKDIRRDGVKIGLMYLETMALMANAYSWGVGHLNRKRPYVFNPNETIARRTRPGSFNSFYGGHCAATAASTFFLAKVYSDYHPDSKFRLPLYGLAIVPPAIVAIYRYKAGMHFPSDNIAGIIGGAALGTAIPHIHKVFNNISKKKSENLSLEPLMGPVKGMYISYKF